MDEYTEKLKKFKQSSSAVYGDPLTFLATYKELDKCYEENWITKLFSTPEEGNIYYEQTLIIAEKLKNEKSRLKNENEKKARFDKDKLIYTSWLDRERRHQQNSSLPFPEPRPHVDPTVIEYFQKKEYEERNAKLRADLEAAMSQNDFPGNQVDVKPDPSQQLLPPPPPPVTVVPPRSAASSTIPPRVKRESPPVVPPSVKVESKSPHVVVKPSNSSFSLPAIVPPMLPPPLPSLPKPQAMDLFGDEEFANEATTSNQSVPAKTELEPVPAKKSSPSTLKRSASPSMSPESARRAAKKSKKEKKEKKHHRHRDSGDERDEERSHRKKHKKDKRRDLERD